MWKSILFVRAVAAAGYAEEAAVPSEWLTKAEARSSD